MCDLEPFSRIWSHIIVKTKRTKMMMSVHYSMLQCVLCLTFWLGSVCLKIQGLKSCLDLPL